MQRWSLYDPLLGETYVFETNPNAMTSPFGPRSLNVLPTAPRIGSIASQGRVIEGNPDPYEWQFSGALRTQNHHDELLRWSRKVNLLELTDHLDRTWSVRFVVFDPDEKKPTARVAWRMDYQMKAYNYGLVA